MAKLIEWDKGSTETKTFSVRISVDTINAFNAAVEAVKKAGGVLTAARVVEQALADATAAAKKELAKREANKKEEKPAAAAPVQSHTFTGQTSGSAKRLDAV